MAEAAGNSEDGRGTMPQRGKVQKVCKDWLVHEDGALAYQLQDKEIQQHYGLNRFNRRTVREDIPVARVAQTDEEQRQQEERFQELQALSAQAEEDAEIAKRVAEELKGEEEAYKRQRELEDEEVARLEQEKEKERYKKHMEKRKEKQLKKEREILEQQLARHTQEARLTTEGGSVEGSLDELHISNDRRAPNGYTRYMYRVTPAGRIEDDGDFSDFYPPISDNVDYNERVQLQAAQDEELARLLQEQEHKRTKAEVDKNKLKEIEEQDARLAKIIHEQEKLKAKKIKQKKKQQEEAKRQQQQQQQQFQNQQLPQQLPSPRGTMTNPATRPLPDLPGQRRSSAESPVPPVQKMDHRKVRRDSFLQSIANGPAPDPRQHTQERMQMQGQNNQRMIPQSLPNSSVDEVERTAHANRNRDQEACYAVSNPIPFNIAAAIDPTYKRRQHEIQQNEETETKAPVSLSRSLPVTDDMDLEWDPSLRGSLRRPKGTWNHVAAGTYDGTLSSRDDNFSDEGPVVNPWQPVQGQRRSASDRTRKPLKKMSPNSQKNSKSSCKQQ
ncbi:hypothetical protein KUTeg_002432 [Tegillarca granosa]|uniref:Coiled-coil domain-containing protein n=1 Tax=Tegillarca granosa TaxID=220873 RepID=A0ABQ9FX42_TEGGR|nr:hypothetical protein KUTeg_002432 [Tegillarca granosa]